MNNTEIPFVKGDWINDIHNPSQPGQYTGKWSNAGPHIMVELLYPGGSTRYRPLSCLELMSGLSGSIEEILKGKYFGKTRDLQRIITYEKLKGSLHEVIYSMEAAQIDFYPYQYKPVLKFINSPSERLIIADEVGLGKTIESALIWIELQARRQAKRLLVVCPKTLTDKWVEELRTKFLFDAHIVDFNELKQEIIEAERSGPGHPFVLIATYTGLRPPKSELKLLEKVLDEETECSPKTIFLNKLYQWARDYAPFDLVIFDEAHYMRNPATTNFHLGKALAANAGAVLCVSATPVNNSNTDLHSLLRLTDESFFETQGLFEELLEANRPAVQAGNALARMPLDMDLLKSALEGMSQSQFIKNSPLFSQFKEKLDQLNPEDKAQLAKCQDLAEKLNILGGYINRTRRIQVAENRPIRDPLVLVVNYSAEEMKLYQAILYLVRARCRNDRRPFHVFQLMGLQLRAASCLPVIAKEICNGRFGEPGDLFNEAIGEDLLDDLTEDNFSEELFENNLEKLLDYNFEDNDSKYNKLKHMLNEVVPDEKVIVFAYYRPTLAYLRRRLINDDIKTAIIHGGMPLEQRWEEIKHFMDNRGPRVLLSSEVGSEGIDLQFCRVIVNYDLPWNPMRIEQRIGRIDRVGQQARRISVVNFKVRDTIEERLYDRLHSKLERFANSLGDLEAVIGREVQRLSVELLSKDLTQEEEIALMERAEQVIEQRLIQVQALEESGDALLALSDYIQQKIKEDREKGRYLQPGELEDYIADFFEREFQGCELNHNTPVAGCLRIRLNQEAQSSLFNFIRDDRSLSARPLRQRDFNITFRREVLQELPINQRSSIHFINHLSPLIRWITKINQERAHKFFKVSALQIFLPQLSPGGYFYRIERWKLKGLSSKEVLAYGVWSLQEKKSYLKEDAEAIIQSLLRQGRDWTRVDCESETLLHANNELEKSLSERFSIIVNDFENENTTAYQIKLQRVENIFNRRITSDEQRLRTLIEAGRDPRVIRATEGMLNTDKKNKEQRLYELEKNAKTDLERSEVAVGIFMVTNIQ